MSGAKLEPTDVLDRWIASAEPALCGPFTEILESQP